ncbi:MAG: hypothetical protein B7Z72_01730 [Gemmatimonadetes bacterium 21-71-4]|nr:MAG: hypothetical protein B7Z72_01730 [Gemmatimonadetes bacterium 21-71-4]
MAICEQVEDPKLAKGVVRREVIETVSPGVALADELLDGGRNNFVCAIHAGDGAMVTGTVGVAAADVSTGELRLSVTLPGELEPLLARLSPREILVVRGESAVPRPATPGLEGALVTERDAWEFDEPMARDDLAQQFGVLSLDGLGLDERDAPAIRSRSPRGAPLPWQAWGLPPAHRSPPGVPAPPDGGYTRWLPSPAHLPVARPPHRRCSAT